MSNSEKTIIFVSHESKLLGAARVLLQVIRYFDATKKYNIMVISPDNGPFIDELRKERIPCYMPDCLQKYYRNISQPGNRIIKLTKRILDNAKLFFYFFRLFREQKNSVVYANTALVRYIVLPAFLLKKKVIWHVHEYSDNPITLRLHTFLIGNCSTKIIINSPFLISKMRLPDRHQKKVEFFRYLSIIDYKDHSAITTFVPDHDLLFAGKISIEKGALDLLQAVNEIVAAKLTLKVAFTGLFVDEKIIRDYVKRHHLEKHVMFYGFVPDINEYILRSKVIVLPSYRDNLPLILLEAIMLERPVICTDVGDIRSVVTHNKNGIIIPPGDVEKLAEAIITILDPERYHHFVNGAIEQKAELLSGVNDFEKLDNIIQGLFHN